MDFKHPIETMMIIVGTILLMTFASIFVINTFFNAVSSNTSDILIIQNRIKPLGQVNIAGNTNIIQANTKLARSGQQVYNNTCASCHAGGILNAPKFRNQADWESKLKLGIDALVKITIKGKGAMPAKGTCMDCSELEIQKAIEYMSQ